MVSFTYKSFKELYDPMAEEYRRLPVYWSYTLWLRRN